MLTIGTDIIDVARVEKKHDAIVARVLRENEKKYCLGSANLHQAIAGHFAAKEAIYKALNINEDAGISWLDIEISHKSSGAPFVQLYNNAKKHADENGLIYIQISISHVKEFATATAICEWK